MKQKLANLTPRVKFKAVSWRLEEIQVSLWKMSQKISPFAFTLWLVGLLACLQSQVGLLLDFLEDEVAKFYKFKFIVLLPTYMISEDDVRFLVRGCVRKSSH